MRVVVHDCFPNHETAEKELVHRFLRALKNLNWEAARADTSDDVLKFKPDCVIATHYSTPKVTEYPTIGMMANPPEYFDLFPNSRANVLSYDAYLPGSPNVVRYIEDLHHSTGKEPVIDEDYFYVSSPRSQFSEHTRSERRLFYVGQRWDAGKRHGDLFHRLAARVPFDVYGPPDRWKDLQQCHKGRVPYDGVSMIDRIREAGIVLAIHSREHLQFGLPTMRIWEGLAAGAVVITDAVEFGKKYFGDNLLYIDPASKRDLVDQIATHVEWVRVNPAEADRMARRGHQLFDEKYCLERQFERLPRLVARIRQASGYAKQPAAVSVTAAPTPAPKPLPTVEYVVRAGTRPIEFVRRALDCLKNQSHPNVAVVLVWMGGREELSSLTREYSDAFLSLKVVRLEPTGVRSEALWAGLDSLTAPFFGMLDDDDYLHPNHVSTVLSRLVGPGAARLARSGGIRVQEDDGHYEDQIYFHGPLGDFVPETRAMAYFGHVDDKQLLDGNKRVLSHSWIAARDLLTETPLRDPHLPVLEDLYLYAVLNERSRCAFSWRATAEWNVRSEGPDNAYLSETAGCADALDRLRLRLTYAAGWVGNLPRPLPPKIVVPVSTATGIWRALTQVDRLGGRVMRGIATLCRSGPKGLYYRLKRVGAH